MKIKQTLPSDQLSVNGVLKRRRRTESSQDLASGVVEDEGPTQKDEVVQVAVEVRSETAPDDAANPSDGDPALLPDGVERLAERDGSLLLAQATGEINEPVRIGDSPSSVGEDLLRQARPAAVPDPVPRPAAPPAPAAAAVVSDLGDDETPWHESMPLWLGAAALGVFGVSALAKSPAPAPAPAPTSPDVFTFRVLPMAGEMTGLRVVVVDASGLRRELDPSEVERVTKTTSAQTDILINGVRSTDAIAGSVMTSRSAAVAADTGSDNTLVNGATGAGKGEVLTLSHLGLAQGLQSGVANASNVSIDFSNLSNITVYKNDASVTTVSMQDVINGNVRLEYSQSDTSVTTGSAYARVDYTVSETGWTGAANFNRSLSFKFSDSQAAIYGDASGNGGRFNSNSENPSAGLGGVDALLGGAAGDIIFGDGSGGGGGGSSNGSFSAANAGVGGGGIDVIYGGAGNDLMLGDGYKGDNGTAAKLYFSGNGGNGGLGGGGGGSGGLSTDGPYTSGTGGIGAGNAGAFNTGTSKAITNSTPSTLGFNNPNTLTGADGVVGSSGYSLDTIVAINMSTGAPLWSAPDHSAMNTATQFNAAYDRLKIQMLNTQNIIDQTPGAGNDYLHGGPGHDMIAGGNGNDTLVGGQGNDILWGLGGSSNGTNNDVFVWQRGDAGSTGAVDEIRDFSPWFAGLSAGMKINLTGLLENHVAGSTADLNQWVTSITNWSYPASEVNNAMSAIGVSTLTSTASRMVIDVDGLGSGTVTQTIYFRNWNAGSVVDPVQWVANGWLIV